MTRPARAVPAWGGVRAWASRGGSSAPRRPGVGGALRRLGLALGLCVGAGAAAAADCPGPAVRPHALAPGLWAVDALAPGVAGDGVRLLVAREGAGLWALGSGPWPAWGAALACQLPRRLGLPLRGLISPWARPEQVLGAAGAPSSLAHVGHAEVAGAMARQCPQCIVRWRERLAEAGLPADEALPPGLQAAVPVQRLSGERGRVGPWHWWRLSTGPTRSLTLWRWAHGPWWHAPGLLAPEGQPPDGQDSALEALRAATRQALLLSQGDGGRVRWTGGEPGPARPRAALQAQAGYWDGLAAALDQALAEGRPEAAPPTPWPGLPAAWAAQPRHALNWQRAWREREARWLDPLPAAQAAARPASQPAGR